MYRRRLLAGVAVTFGAVAAGCGRKASRPTATEVLSSASRAFTSALSKAAGGVSVSPAGSTLVPSVASASTAETLTITAESFSFQPLSLFVASGATITFTSTDVTPYAVQLAPGAPAAWPKIALTQGKSVTQRISAPGVYRFYDPTFATWDASASAVESLTASPAYPAAMEGLLCATGTGFSGTEVVSVSATKGGLFSPTVVVIEMGGTVTWTNALAGVCQLESVDGLINVSVRAGGTASQAFPTTGIHHYYCANYAGLDPATGQVVAIQGVAPGYPLAMQGWICVV